MSGREDPSRRLERLTPERLSEAPERAALAALRAVLEISERALLSANPELLDETWSTQRGRSHYPSLRAAHRILARGYALEREIARYEEHLLRLLDRSAVATRDDLPF